MRTFENQLEYDDGEWGAAHRVDRNQSRLDESLNLNVTELIDELKSSSEESDEDGSVVNESFQLNNYFNKKVRSELESEVISMRPVRVKKKPERYGMQEV